MEAKTTVLIVDDEDAIRVLLTTILETAGYTVLQAADGPQALSLFASHQASINLLLIDVMMNPMDGLTLCKELRSNCRVPMVMLTALANEEAERMAFEAGADDYVTKPIKPSALLARLERRLQLISRPNIQQTIESNGISINTKTHATTFKGDALLLSATEYNLLLYLVEHPKQVISRQQLLDNVWGADYVGTLRTVDVHMARLRMKLGRHGASLIQAVRGFGYSFAP